MREKAFKISLLAAALLTLSLSVSHCGPVKFSGSNPASLTTQGAPICTPFGGGGAQANNGLVADKIYYLTSNQNTSQFTVFSDFVNGAEGIVNQPLYMNDVNVPNRYFTSGFTDESGAQLKEPDGTTLTAFFGFELKSVLVPADWAPGDYQIAVLSDDGSILTVQNGVQNQDGSTSDFVINNDGTHSLKLGCTTSVLHVSSSGQQFPLTFDYFQGPPQTIGMIILARPMPTGNPQDPQCGMGGDSDTYWFNDNSYPNPPVQQQTYTDLLNRGWTPIASNHYLLPNGGTNPCVQ